jgi:ketosteroid isomerase-like protein
MSQENVELVRRITDAHARGDFKGARKLIDRDTEYELIDFHEMEWPLSTYKEVVDAVRDYLEAWDTFSMQPTEFVDRGDEVAVILEARGRGQGGKEIQRHLVEVWTVAEGKAVGYRLYRGRQQALASMEQGGSAPRGSEPGLE